MNGETTAPSGKLGMVGKHVLPTPWIKLSADEKVERTREQIKNIQSSVYRIENYTRRLRELLSKHSHLDGKVVEEITTYEGIVGGNCVADSLAQNPETIYF